MLAIVDKPFPNGRMVLEKRGRAVAHEEVDWCVRKRAPKVLEQRRGQHDVAKAAQLHEEHLTRM